MEAKEEVKRKLKRRLIITPLQNFLLNFPNTTPHLKSFVVGMERVISGKMEATTLLTLNSPPRYQISNIYHIP